MATAQNTVYISANGKTRNVTLTENSATSELLKLLKNGAITVRMNDYGGFEKVGELPQPFTTSESHITTQPGDIMLYQGNQMVIFYGSNSWSYTPLGKIDNATSTNIKEFLGKGAVEVKITLSVSTGIENVNEDVYTEEIVYDMNGRTVTHRPLSPGIYIVNGKKTVIK